MKTLAVQRSPSAAVLEFLPKHRMKPAIRGEVGPRSLERPRNPPPERHKEKANGTEL